MVKIREFYLRSQNFLFNTTLLKTTPLKVITPHVKANMVLKAKMTYIPATNLDKLVTSVIPRGPVWNTDYGYRLKFADNFCTLIGWNQFFLSYTEKFICSDMWCGLSEFSNSVTFLYYSLNLIFAVQFINWSIRFAMIDSIFWAPCIRAISLHRQSFLNMHPLSSWNRNLAAKLNWFLLINL